MRQATLSILGLYRYDPTLFDNFQIPEALIFPGLNLNVEWRFTDDETSNPVNSRSIPLRPDTV